jgi:phospholipase C
MGFDRRSFLQLLGTGALAGSLPESIAKALAIPANHGSGTIADVDHIVLLMQENRSFDHYFGTLRGVRGFGDPRAVTLPDGHPVFHQPDGAGGHVLPFRPGADNLGLRFLRDLAHDWNTTQRAWNQGRYDQWVPAKTSLTMAHLQRADIPYHYALADAFTVCDAYHCSLLGPTDPNRYHMFTGWVGNDGQGGGPVVDNAETGYGWSTFPEVLEQAGVSWKVYQDEGLGLDAEGQWGQTKDAYIGTYGDNSLLFFDQYRRAQPGSPLYDKARTGTRVATGGSLFDHFRRDVATNSLPQVSWLVAPEAYTEHPNWPANYGAYYISQILDALTANPKVWGSTAFFIMYDENDGFFDHAVPPTPPQNASQGLSNVSIANEIFPGRAEFPEGPYGLGARVPMLVISPWSKGGWVNSEVFDHTSLIRFIQRRFGTAREPLPLPNITEWRRAVCGDLTSAFDFTHPNSAGVTLPSTIAYVPADRERHENYQPLPPAVQAMPIQEPGTRPARAVPYELNVEAVMAFATGELTLAFVNTGSRAAVFHVRADRSADPPRNHTVMGRSRLIDTWSAAKLPLPAYCLSVYGPNGFYRRYQGGLDPASSVNIETTITYDIARYGITLTATNLGSERCELDIQNAYITETSRRPIDPGALIQQFFALDGTSGWYDLTLKSNDAAFRQQLAGHLENGRDSISDPGIPLKSARIP